MKKYLFFAFAAVAVVFASCNNDSQPTDVVKLKLSQNYAEIGVDEELRLNTTITPTTLGLQLTYTSSDPSVVTVSGSGLLTGVSLGEAYVRVSAKDAEGDSCKVIVSDMAIYNDFNIADYGLFGEFEPIEGTDTTLVLSNGDTVLCDLNFITVYAWDGNAKYVSGTGFAGDGWVLRCDDVPFYVIKEDKAHPQYVGYYIGEGGFGVAEQEDGSYTAAWGRPGKMDLQSCGDMVAAQYSSDTTRKADFDTWEELNQGAFLTEPFGAAGNIGCWYGFFSGKINKVLFIEAIQNKAKTADSIPARWAIDLDFASVQPDRLWGFRVDTAHYAATYVEGKGGEIELIEPYDYATVHRVFDENGLFEDDEAAAPARLAGKKQASVRELGDMKKLHLGVYLDKNSKVLPATDRMYKK